MAPGSAGWRRFAAAACGIAFLSVVAPAAWAAGLNLHWDDCTLGRGLNMKVDACGSIQADPLVLIGSIDPPHMVDLVNNVASWRCASTRLCPRCVVWQPSPSPTWGLVRGQLGRA